VGRIAAISGVVRIKEAGGDVKRKGQKYEPYGFVLSVFKEKPQICCRTDVIRCEKKVAIARDDVIARASLALPGSWATNTYLVWKCFTASPPILYSSYTSETPLLLLKLKTRTL
jgi:hypothetical protein